MLYRYLLLGRDFFQAVTYLRTERYITRRMSGKTVRFFNV